MRLRQWDFSEKRRFPGAKSYYDSCKCTRKQINFRAVCWPIQGGAEWRCADSAECGAAGLMWQIKANTNDFLTLIYKYSKKRPGLVCPGRKCFRGTTCIQSLALHFVSTDILCSCNVELTLKPTWHVRLGLVDQTGYTVWFTARGLLPQFVHKSSHRPLSLCASRGCVLLPVMAFGWYRDIHCPNRVDKCFLGLHYTFIERKLSTGFWIIAVKFMFLNEFWLRYWERSEQ